MLGLLKASDSRGFNPNYLIELQGTDLVISLDGAPFFRCPAVEVTTDAETVSSTLEPPSSRGSDNGLATERALGAKRAQILTR